MILSTENFQLVLVYKYFLLLSNFYYLFLTNMFSFVFYCIHISVKKTNFNLI
jgi:hypothetical protein